MEDIEHKLKLLAGIEAAEPNPYLLTRIKQRIENASSVYYSKKFVWSAGISLMILLSFNVIKIAASKGQANDTNLVEEFNLMQNNTLYK